MLLIVTSIVARPGAPSYSSRPIAPFASRCPYCSVRPFHSAPVRDPDDTTTSLPGARRSSHAKGCQGYDDGMKTCLNHPEPLDTRLHWMVSPPTGLTIRIHFGFSSLLRPFRSLRPTGREARDRGDGEGRQFLLTMQSCR